MKIAVLVKEVPDTWGERSLDAETGLTRRDAVERVLDEIGERALEVALSRKDTDPSTEVVVLTMGPAEATANVRKALATGADSAVHVVDDALVGADLGLTAQTLAAALQRIGADLVITGNQSTDGTGGVLGSMLAELLDLPAATSLESVEIGSDAVTGVRVVDGGSMKVSADYPALISITERLPDARFPNFKGIMAAKKKPLETLSLADLGVDAADYSVPRAIMTAVGARPPRAAGTKITDEGDAGERLAAFLIENRLA